MHLMAVVIINPETDIRFRKSGNITDCQFWTKSTL